jgi:hypothetical protein
MAADADEGRAGKLGRTVARAANIENGATRGCDAPDVEPETTAENVTVEAQAVDVTFGLVDATN